VFGAEFLGYPKVNISCDDGNISFSINEKTLFMREDSTAPILAHLGKREMGKNYDHSYMTFMKDGKLIHQHFFSERKHRTTKRTAIKNENNFISLWSAIEATGEK